MHSFLSRFTITLLLVAGTAFADSPIGDLSVNEFKALVDSGEGILLDVRTPKEVAQGKIPGASVLNIYDENFERKLNFMQKDKPIYVYCRSGVRSVKASRILAGAGFTRIENVEGGIMAWQAAGFPTEQ